MHGVAMYTYALSINGFKQRFETSDSRTEIIDCKDLNNVRMSSIVEIDDDIVGTLVRLAWNFSNRDVIKVATFARPGFVSLNLITYR